jgi:hypothetical protein
LAFNLINDYHETIRRLSEEKLRLVRRLHAFLEKHANRLQMNLDRINGIQKSQTQTQTDHLTDVAPATNTPARSEPVTHAESGDKSPIGISPDASIGDAIYILEGFLKEDSLNGFSTLLETSETIIKGPIIEDQSSVSSSANTTMKSHNSKRQFNSSSALTVAQYPLGRISEAIPRDQDISASSSPVAAPLMNGATSGDETTLDDFGLDEILASVTISGLESLKSPSSPATSEATLRSLLTDDDDGRTAFTGRSIIDEDESEEKARNIHDARQGDEEED